MSVSTVFNEYSGGWVGQDVSFTDTATAFTIPKPGRWRFLATTDVWVRRVKTGNATASAADGSTLWPAGTIWYEDVTADDIARSEARFSVIRSATNGTLYVNSASRI